MRMENRNLDIEQESENSIGFVLYFENNGQIHITQYTHTHTRVCKEFVSQTKESMFCFIFNVLKKKNNDPMISGQGLLAYRIPLTFLFIIDFLTPSISTDTNKLNPHSELTFYY